MGTEDIHFYPPYRVMNGRSCVGEYETYEEAVEVANAMSGPVIIVDSNDIAIPNDNTWGNVKIH